MKKVRLERSPKSVGKKIGGTGNHRKNGDYPDNNLVHIDQNTEKSPEDLRRLVVTQ